MSALGQLGEGQARGCWGMPLLVLALIVALVGCVVPRSAAALGVGVSLTPSTTRPYYACPKEACDEIIDPPAIKTAAGYELPAGGPALEGSGELGGYDPKDLQSAYDIPTSGGEGQTVAVVDVGGYPDAESDLAKYREKYGLSACTKVGGCFKKINQSGEEANYPEGSEGWQRESALDLDMVSAACPGCHIMLMEANKGSSESESASNLAATVNKAAELGATEISNSYGFPENYEPWCGKTDCAQFSSDYDHPGVAIFASAGDYGYDNRYWGPDFGLYSVDTPDFPSTSPYVTAVGGTFLKKAEGTRGWKESVWNETDIEESEYSIGTGSGCSASETKPSWQKDSGCSDRTGNDIAAVGACKTPVSVYRDGGWENVCGTSASSPLVAGIEAHAGPHTRSLGANAFYEKPSMLFHVGEGSNGECGSLESSTWYLCNATAEGYNGPTGLGSPDGVPDVPGWLTQSTPNPEGGGRKILGGVSCVSLSACVAVGHWEKAYPSEQYTLAETWNGSTWSIQSTANPKEASWTRLDGVSCVSSTFCIAVGAYDSAGKTVTLAERWNGTEWSIQTTRNPSGASESALFGVSCTSSAACVAVGEDNASGERVPLAESWDGTEWSLQSIPSPSGAERSHLAGVSCTSASACVAVGESWEESSSVLAERWNGTAWSVQSTPAGSAGLMGVSCVSATSCTAVGWQGNEENPLAEHWNGTGWSTQTISAPSQYGASLSGVSCASETVCMAVGAYAVSSREIGVEPIGDVAPYAEQWNGTKWSIEATPNPTGVYNYLGAVSCASELACAAVGEKTPKEYEYGTFVERYSE